MMMEGLSLQVVLVVVDVVIVVGDDVGVVAVVVAYERIVFDMFVVDIIVDLLLQME